jgi:Virulence-associated protein E/Bifunctional DNA primase/polymerase, N-terminal
MPAVIEGGELVLPDARHSVAESARIYAEAGFAPVPVWGVVDGVCRCGRLDCKAQGKHPVGAGWQKRARADVDVARELFEAHEGNIGIVLGDELVVVDIDGYHGGFDGVKTLPLMPRTLTSRSGSGQGEHRIFRLAPGQDAGSITNRCVAQGVDVKIRAGQFVAAPSLHKSGRRYEWIDRTPPAYLPEALYEAIRRPQNVIPLRPVVPARTVTGGDDYALLKKRAVAYMSKVAPAVSGQRGHDAAFAAARALRGWIVKGLPESDAWGLFAEWNAKCDPPWSERELQHKWTQASKATAIPMPEDRPREAAPVARGAAVVPRDDGAALVARGGSAAPREDGAAPVASASRASMLEIEGGNGGNGGGGAPPGGGPPPGPSDSNWRGELIFDRKKNGPDTPAKHHINAVVVLKLCPAWRGKIRLDTHAQRIFVTDPPWHPLDLPTPGPRTREWQDSDSGRLSNWIRREVSGLSLSPDQCHTAVQIVAEANTYHPFREYLDSLVWDGVPRIDHWLRVCLGATSTLGDDTVISAMGRWWLIGAAARTFRPGCKMDNVLILEGPQGLKKSSALKLLAGAEFFSDTPVDIGSKDAYMALQGRVIVELAELDSLRRAHASQAKTFFSSSSDRFRPPYGRCVVEVPRACVMAGTVNPGAYLTDDTGNRRYWPVQCSQVLLKPLEEMRDQLWAEAAHRFKAGERWWPETREELDALEAEQLVREETDPWAEAIGDWVAGRDVVTTHEVLEGAVKLAVEDFTRAHEQRVGRVLRQFAFKRRRVVREGKQRWEFKRQADGKVHDHG